MTTEAIDTSPVAAFPPLWLRDNCPCSECRDSSSHQKLFQLLDLPDDVEILELVDHDDEIEITFLPDHHRSVFSREWLHSQANTHLLAGRTEDSKQLWRAIDIDLTTTKTTWTKYCDDNVERLRVLRGVERLGLALIEGTPAAPATVLDIVATFGFVRETNYGELFDVRIEPDPSNLAFTGLAITPHTDNPYRDPVPTMQLLHCLVNSVEGGESGLVDSFLAASLLREEDPQSFIVLTRTSVDFAWSDAHHSLRARRPLIDVDEHDRVQAVRFNNRSMQALHLEHDRVIEFYAAHRRFAAILARPELELTFRLEPGDCVIFDNTRLMHSRTAFKETDCGSRHLQGCYADLDGLASTVEILKRSTNRIR
jgi:gamma-butyrobetaine dioxygenase